MRKGRKSGPSTAGESRRLGWIPNSKIFINCTDFSAGAEKPPTPRIMRPQEYLSYFQRAANDFLRFGNRFDECRWYACVRPPPSWQNKSHREKPLKDANRFSREMGKSLIYKTKRETPRLGVEWTLHFFWWRGSKGKENADKMKEQGLYFHMKYLDVDKRSDKVHKSQLTPFNGT